MKALRDKTAWLIGLGLVLVVFQGAKRAAAEPPPTSRHDECLSIAQQYLPEVTLKNVCDVPIDLKWCHMTRAGTNIGCHVEHPLDPRHFVSTGACAGCVWKVNYEVFLFSDHAEWSFSSDADMLANLRSH